MSDGLAPLDAELARLAAGASPAQLAKVSRSIAADMRTANARRIRANVTPDGAAMEPRKTLRPTRLGDAARAGRRIKPARMYAKAPGALVRRSNAQLAQLGFSGAGDRIMAVHQLGLIDSVSRESGAPKVAYPERPVLGFSDADRARIFDKVAAGLIG